MSAQDEIKDYTKRIQDLDAMIDGFMSRPELLGSPEDARKEYWKKRNALYSQRKYYRKKLKMKELECRRDDLVARNGQIRQQNYVFEQMLSCANEQVKIIKLIEQNIHVQKEQELQDRLCALSSLPSVSHESQKRPALTAGDLLRSRAGIPPPSHALSFNEVASLSLGMAGATTNMSTSSLPRSGGGSFVGEPNQTALDPIVQLHRVLTAERNRDRAMLPSGYTLEQSYLRNNWEQDDLERLLRLHRNSLDSRGSQSSSAHEALLLAQQQVSQYLEDDTKHPSLPYSRYSPR